MFQEKTSVAMKKYDYVKEPQPEAVEAGKEKTQFGTQTFSLGGSAGE